MYDFESIKLYLVFQPVKFYDGRIHHYEALLRIDEDYDLVDFFLWVEQRASRSIRLDFAVLEMALQEMNRNPHMKIAVNVSALSACCLSFADEYVAKIIESGISAQQQIYVEVTETFNLTPSQMFKVNKFLKNLRKIGVKSYVDDFRIWDLHRVWFFTNSSTVKVDISVVKKGDFFVVLAILLARLNFKEVVVEGIEKDSTLNLARFLRCLSQGFHPELGKPKPSAPINLTK
jgi:EAL domain-containing protein (putative c-di-GMP-specific phosphodiesterase class I)